VGENFNREPEQETSEGGEKKGMCGGENRTKGTVEGGEERGRKAEGQIFGRKNEIVRSSQKRPISPKDEGD